MTPRRTPSTASTAAVRNLANRVRSAIDAEHPAAAIAAFMSEAGAPPEVIAAMSTDPELLAIARTMPYDHEVMGDFDRGGRNPHELVAAIDVPTLVIAGGASPDFLRDAIDRIAAVLPNATVAMLDGYDHDAPADVVAPVVAGFLVDDR